MRDLGKIIEHVERAMTQNLDAPPRASLNPPRMRSRTAWRAPDARPRAATAAELAAHRQFQKEITMSTSHAIMVKAVKVTVPLSPESVLTLAAREGQQRVKFVVNFDGGSLSVDIAAKALRRAQKAISENGGENTFCMIQGRLKGTEIMEAGLVAQARISASQANEEDK